ncbi:DUF4142 domain-containing protein [uncultured Tistrella sp.]|uniref:DUF4142 domain-containing protein n=1 Tax=Tistrella mobilis TaxID=171437 RepID=UPI000C0B8C40|nr:DUF4142 domain-containing protein [uncultured Tistrella sp.]MAM76761.1 DUF305 domain-containing protein [Tistrella sp.]
MIPRPIRTTTINAVLAARLFATAAGAVLIGSGIAAGANMTVPASSTAAYTEEAALSDIFEIEAAKLARNKTQNDDIRAFAGRMVLDHTAATEKMKETLADMGLSVQLPARLDDRRMKILEDLNEQQIPGFDRMYVATQIEAHEAALQLHRGYAEAGENEELRETAAEIADTVERHLEHIRDIADEMND